MWRIIYLISMIRTIPLWIVLNTMGGYETMLNSGFV